VTRRRRNPNRDPFVHVGCLKHLPSAYRSLTGDGVDRRGVSARAKGTISMERKSRVRRGAALLCGVALCGMAVAGPVGAAPHKPTKPGAPTVTSVKVGIRSATVNFAKPASNGGSRILSYRVVCKSSNGGARRATSGLRSPIKVSGLSVKTYTCTVAARNKVGTGPASAPSKPFVPKAHK
jgi:hypothetical protein